MSTVSDGISARARVVEATAGSAAFVVIGVIALVYAAGRESSVSIWIAAALTGLAGSLVGIASVARGTGRPTRTGLSSVAVFAAAGAAVLAATAVPERAVPYVFGLGFVGLGTIFIAGGLTRLRLGLYES